MTLIWRPIKIASFLGWCYSSHQEFSRGDNLIILFAWGSLIVTECVISTVTCESACMTTQKLYSLYEGFRPNTFTTVNQVQFPSNSTFIYTGVFSVLLIITVCFILSITIPYEAFTSALLIYNISRFTTV